MDAERPRLGRSIDVEVVGLESTAKRAPARPKKYEQVAALRRCNPIGTCAAREEESSVRFFIPEETRMN
jgi:hypothetical protein